MKKALTICIVLLLSISSFSVLSSAKEVSGWYSTVTVNNETVNVIKNEYYRHYYNELFESAYNTYQSNITAYKNAKEQPEINIPDIMSENIIIINKTNEFFYSESIEKIGYSFYQELRNSDDTYYIMMILSYDDEVTKDNNQKILASINEVNEILYVGDTTPCAIISVIGKKYNRNTEQQKCHFCKHTLCSYRVYAFIKNT